MAICDLQTPLGRVQKETKRLKDSWLATKVHWQDKAASDFEETYLQPLIPTLQLTLAAAYELAEAIGDAEKACGDDGPP